MSNIEYDVRLKDRPQSDRVDGDGLCDDCPPVGYETDKTRCLSCPRHATPQQSGNSGEGKASYQETKQQYRDMLATPKPAPNAVREALADRLEHAVVTMQNDDLSEPMSEKRDRHVARSEAMRDVVEYLRAAPVPSPDGVEERHSCPCGTGNEPCPNERGELLCATPPDRDEIARRMLQTFEVTGDIWFKRAADALSLPGQSGAGEREIIIALVEKSMRDTWNDICSDTDCHPDDIEHGRGKILFFEPKHWARFTGEAVADALSRQPQSNSEGEKR